MNVIPIRPYLARRTLTELEKLLAIANLHRIRAEIRRERRP